MIDRKALLADLRVQVSHLSDDLREQVSTLPGLAGLLHAEHAAEHKAARTAAAWPEWSAAMLTQAAVGWVLGTVFLRWSEDNGLIDPVISGPGERLAAAEDAQFAYYGRHPEHTDGDWLDAQFEVLRGCDAGRLLVDREHNPAFWVPPSHDGAKALIAFWRARRPSGELVHDFRDPEWDTRFLGDLYQDLSEDAKSRYALLQRVRSDARAKALNALRQLVDEVDSGRFPGLYLLVTGTPAFFDGRQGVPLLPPLASRLQTDFATDARFDNPRAVQVRLTGFDLPRLVELGGRVRDLYAAGSSTPDRIRSTVDDGYLRVLANAVAGGLGGRVGVAPRVFLRKLVADVLDRVEQFDDFDPRRHYALTISGGELTEVERQAAASTPDDVDIDV